MQLAIETQVLYELALSIGESNELGPMLRHTVSELLRLTNASGACVLQMDTANDLGDANAPPLCVCMLPRNLDRHAAHRELSSLWSPAALYHALRDRPEQLPLTVPLAGATAHAFLLPHFGLLVLFRKQGPLAENFLRAFGPLARKLGSAARSCVLEEELRRQSWRLEMATSTANIGVWQFDVASGTLTWDAAMHRMFGIDVDLFHGHMDQFLAAVHPDDRERVATEWPSLAAGDRFESEFSIIRGDGARRQIYGCGRMQRDANGAPVTLLGINTDITSRKEAEAELRRARDLAEATNQAKSHFIANMSHELRTPLNGVIGMTELALESGLNETQREYLRVARSSADSLLTILNDILDFSKIDAGEMLVETIPFSLPVVVAESLKSLTTRAAQRQLELVLDLPTDFPPFNLGDPGRLRQILVNLCDNAIKFTPQGEIVVLVRAVAEGPVDQIALTVKDSGIGIAPDKLEQIFDAFQQVDASITRRFGGTGLGLSISRRLAQLMGGKLTVASTLGEGSAFTLTLSLPRAETPAGVSLPARSRWDGRRALLIDDHALGRTALSLWLRHWGFDVEEAPDGASGLAALRAAHRAGRPIDVVITDAIMPGLDGFEVAAVIASEQILSPGRVLMLSSGGRRGDAARCRELGIAGFLTKPATPTELREVLSRVLDAPEGGEPNGELITRYLLKERPRTRRVLLVEDNVVNQAVAEGMLVKLGYEVCIAENGEEALARIGAESFDLIFMDVQMPVLDGVAATREIRRREGSARHTPIVAMTANAMADEREQCLAAGMDDHLAKPVRLAVLQDVLQRYAPR
ncbi:response regulator [Gemmatimonas sp.]|uniref:response regulator n=1 Tax=Gemmatimonas sp. TaxID=1962908 RepID=UPI003F72D826